MTYHPSYNDDDKVQEIITYIPWFTYYERRHVKRSKKESVFNLGPTAIVDILSPRTGRTWMDRNLGALQVATSPTDFLAYGDLYQYGRRKDGHENRISFTAGIKATSNLVAPDTDKFITGFDSWTTSNPSEFWNQTNTGVNDVWPPGYRLPTREEWEAEIAGWGPNKSQSAFDSLKLTLGGLRIQVGPDAGRVISEGSLGSYPSSNVTTNVSSLNFGERFVTFSNKTFGIGQSIRLIQKLPVNVPVFSTGLTPNSTKDTNWKIVPQGDAAAPAGGNGLLSYNFSSSTAEPYDYTIKTNFVVTDIDTALLRLVYRVSEFITDVKINGTTTGPDVSTTPNMSFSPSIDYTKENGMLLGNNVFEVTVRGLGQPDAFSIGFLTTVSIQGFVKPAFNPDGTLIPAGVIDPRWNFSLKNPVFYNSRGQGTSRVSVPLARYTANTKIDLTNFKHTSAELLIKVRIPSSGFLDILLNKVSQGFQGPMSQSFSPLIILTNNFLEGIDNFRQGINELEVLYDHNNNNSDIQISISCTAVPL